MQEQKPVTESFSNS